MKKKISERNRKASTANSRNNPKALQRKRNVGSGKTTNPVNGNKFSAKKSDSAIKNIDSKVAVSEKIAESSLNEENQIQKIEENGKCHSSITDCGRFACACIAVCLVAGCAIFEYFFNHEKYCELAKHSAEMSALVQEVSERTKSLEQRTETLEKGLVQMEGRAGSSFGNKAREKWKVWIALKNKLELGESFEEELKAFESTFAYDQDLISLLTEAIGAVETESQISDDTVVDAVKKYMNRVVTVGRISNSKLLEISGYVITSIEGSAK